MRSIFFYRHLHFIDILPTWRKQEARSHVRIFVETIIRPVYVPETPPWKCVLSELFLISRLSLSAIFKRNDVTCSCVDRKARAKSYQKVSNVQENIQTNCLQNTRMWVLLSLKMHLYPSVSDSEATKVIEPNLWHLTYLATPSGIFFRKKKSNKRAALVNWNDIYNVICDTRYGKSRSRFRYIRQVNFLDSDSRVLYYMYVQLLVKKNLNILFSGVMKYAVGK